MIYYHGVIYIYIDYQLLTNSVIVKRKRLYYYGTLCGL